MKITPCPYTHPELKAAWEKGYKNEEYDSSSEVARRAYSLGVKAHEKDTDVLPRGYYCYRIIGPMENGILPTRVCPYLTTEEKSFEEDGKTEKYVVAICSFLKQQATPEDLEDPFFAEIHDQVKECGEKYND